MRFIDSISPSHAVRLATAITLVAVLTAGVVAPLSAYAEAVVAADSSLVSWHTSATGSVDTTPTPGGLDWVFGSLPSTGSVEPTEAAPAKDLRTVRQIIIDTGRDAGLSRAEIKALLWLAWRESRYHPTSHSRSGYHGLFQLSPGMAHGKPWKDPEWNTRRAIKYMNGRYGGVLEAKAFWQENHWY